MCLMCRQLYLLAICSLLMATSNGHSYKEVIKNRRISHYKQDDHTQTYNRATMKEKWLWMMTTAGPGSHPPLCTRKCGSCTPCRPVHVPVPPGATDSAEYYPEAWRCKCGNHLYLP
ncbi:EPIDERMAL PATTERNING FACTOR-like protein [Rhynchospora pubera]|uniref:Epidermal patterning factor-like protein n=1 Tax=Rhynchospora pubera TaxID=906938 RepID=A0AAV8CH89_9POAL|nr:EPIDERMAL PATTERNING FACTOR-like protein [Rhynchospora pubera]